MSQDLLLGLFLGGLVAIVLYIVLSKRQKNSDTLTEELEKRLNEVFPKVLQNANEQLISMANQKLGAEKQDIKTDLDNKRRTIEKLVERVQQDLKDADRTSQSLLQRIQDHERITKELSATTEGLKKVLTNNQLRGQFGEQVAEDLLKMAGFVHGVDFETQKKQGTKSTGGRPDFAVFLPDRTRINIDVKFPYANLQKSTETDDKNQKAVHLKAFAQDVKTKISQISTRDYINPEEKTVDFVILFVPNEMIFSYIYDKMHAVWEEAMQKKVIIAGPFSFTAILRMVRQAHNNFRYQENIQQIVSYIHEFDKQFEMYNEEFSKIGAQLETVQKTYNRVDSTRTSQLQRVVEKIKLESGESDTPALNIAPTPLQPKAIVDESDSDIV